MDRGQKETEKILSEVEKRIEKEYAQAIEDIEVELSDYLRRFETKDKTWQKWVENGTRTEAEYIQWKKGQLAVGQRWSAQKQIIAEQLYRVNEKAKDIYKSSAPEIFAENANFATYDIEKQAKVNTSFMLYNEDAVKRLVKENPEVLPPVGRKVAKDIAEGKAVRWNRQQLQSVMIQGIMQGDSIPKLATRLANTVGDKNRNAAIRNARTMATMAQNAGRVNAFKRAQSKGVDLTQRWMAVMDNRTRHSHRWLDGEERPVGEAFSNGCEYPGDPKGDPAEIYNCRCCLRGVVKGLERRSGLYRDTSAVGGMSYDEWKKAKPITNRITLPEEKAKNIKMSYLRQYAGNGIIGSSYMSRAITTNTIERLERVTSSPVIELESYEDVQLYFATNYDIEVNGFEGKDIFSIKATMAGYDDMLREFPETQGALKTIMYNPSYKDYGNWDSHGTSQVGPRGLKDYGTGVHETAHVLDYVRGYNYSYSKKVVEQARKNLNYRANGKDYKDEWTKICGMPYGIKETDREKFAYAMETAKGGGTSKLAQEIYRIAKEGL